MGKALTKRGPIAATTVYTKGTLVARDVTVTLPEVTPATAEVKAMGTVDIPNPAQIESMELALTKQGIDKELAMLAELGMHDIEIRWVQDIMRPDGTIEAEGCKAFIKAMAKKVPGLSIEVGSASENEMTFSVVRYQLYAGGSEVLLVDKLNSILRVNGKDYTRNIDSLL